MPIVWLTVVLDKGEIVETGAPSELIEREGGLFRDMCAKSGMMDELRAAAFAKQMVLEEGKQSSG